jgi:sugar (pentulose or hexulose) kinase
VAGLCFAVARNVRSNLARGRDLETPVVFQGGVAANAGVVRAFGEALDAEITVPPHHQLMGAMGAALLAQEGMDGRRSAFRGFEAARTDFQTVSFECRACPNLCEIAEIRSGGEVAARWGGRCGRWGTN